MVRVQPSREDGLEYCNRSKSFGWRWRSRTHFCVVDSLRQRLPGDLRAAISLDQTGWRHAYEHRLNLAFSVG